MNMPVTVGIPRALSYYTYYPLWKTFLENMGVKVVVSRVTNKEILDWGIKETVNDACIPIKIMHGHVMDLKDKVDFLFVPRMVSADGKATFCPKFLGLPDMVRFSGNKLPPIIDTRFHLMRVPGGLLRFFLNLARQIGRLKYLRVAKAMQRAVRAQRLYTTLLSRGWAPARALALVEKDSGKPTQEDITSNSSLCDGEERRLKVALLGYPYAIYDPFVSANILQRLENMGVEVITPEKVPPRELRRMSSVLPQNFFWYYSNRVAWSGLYIMENRVQYDGLIHVTAFGCGPDAMVDKFLELEAKKAGLPFMTLSIDEHTGEGGVQTRLEAFVDMLQSRPGQEEAEAVT